MRSSMSTLNWSKEIMSMSLLRTWWAMVKADSELAGEPIADDTIVLHFMGSGASCHLTKKQLDDALEERPLNKATIDELLDF